MTFPQTFPGTVREEGENAVRRYGGPGIRTPMGLRPAVFKTAALPVRSSPPRSPNFNGAMKIRQQNPDVWAVRI